MIKKIETADIKSVMNLIGASVEHMFKNGIDQWDSIYPDRDTVSTDIKNSYAYGYFVDNEPAGYMALSTRYDVEYNDVNWKYNHDNSLILHRLTVHPKHQRKGIARKMMAYCEEYAIDNGYNTIRFDTFSENPGAMTLYKSLGYSIPGYVNFRKGKFWVFEKKIS